MKFNQLKNNFSSGELSELLVGRVDLEEYQNGCQTFENFIPLKQGGAKYRSGTQLVKQLEEAGSASDRVCFPFIAATISYVISYDGVNFYATTSGGTTCTVTNNAGSVSLTDFENQRFHYAQYNDILVVTCSDGTISPLVFVRTAATTFVLDNYIDYLQSEIFGSASKQLALRQPFNPTNLSTTTFTPSGTSGSITITASAATFASSHIGRTVRITHAGTTGVAQITAYTSTTQVTATVLVNFGATTASAVWAMSAWWEGNYPKAVCFFEQRLVFGGSVRQPDSIWCSEQGDIFQFMQSRLAQDSSTDTSGLGYFGAATVTDPFDFTIASQTGASIQFLVGSEFMYAGSKSGIYQITGGQDQSLSISSIFIKKISNHSTAAIMPQLVDAGFCFVGIDRKTLYSMVIGQESPNEISVLFLNKIERIVELAWQSNQSILWVLSYTDGVYGVAYEPKQKVLAWFQSPISGSTDNQDYTTTVQGICCLDRGQGVHPHFLVKRDYGTLQEVAIEAIYPDNQMFGTFAGSMDEQEIFLDRCEAVNVSATDTISVVFPDDTVVHAMFEGEDLGEFTVASGNVVIPQAVTGYVLVGFKYTGTIKTMPFEAGQTFGQAQGLPRRVERVIFRTYRSRGGEYFADAGNSFPIIPTTVAYPDTYSSEIERHLNASPHDVTLTIKQDTPNPMTVLWAMLRGVTYDG